MKDLDFNSKRDNTATLQVRFETKALFGSHSLFVLLLLLVCHRNCHVSEIP
ncbi:unnamed protein product, partial [Cuscuta epithymum]